MEMEKKIRGDRKSIASCLMKVPYENVADSGTAVSLAVVLHAQPTHVRVDVFYVSHLWCRLTSERGEHYHNF